MVDLSSGIRQHTVTGNDSYRTGCHFNARQSFASHGLRGFLCALLLGLLTVSSGCAQHWCVAVLQPEDSLVTRAQSPDGLDPAFSQMAASPAASPATAALEPGRQTIPAQSYDTPLSNPLEEIQQTGGEAPTDMERELLAPPGQPLYKASTLLDSASEPEGPPKTDESLADVRIEGNATIPAAAMMRYVKSRPGRPTTVNQVQDDVRALYNTNWFFSIEPVYRREAGGVILVFKVVERPILRSVEYRGNEKIKNHLLDGITGLKPMHAFSVATNREAARRIQEHYVEKGYLFAEVTLAEGADPEDRTVIFDIKEGPKVQVGAIKFEGNSDISSELLKLRLTTKKRILWKFGGQYDPANIPEDIAAIKEYYHNIGYFDVMVKDKIEFSEDQAVVTLTYQITEGLRYKIRNINIDGNQVFSLDELTKEFKTASGNFYSARELTKDINGIQTKYGELGRLFAKVNTSTVFAQEPGIVDIKMSIDEDRVWKIGMINVHIRGEHSHTKETVALNQMLIAPGDLADPEKIRRTKARFAGASIWESAGPTAPDINIKPVTDPTYLAKNTTTDPLIVRGADGYFGGERPLNLKTVQVPPAISSPPAGMTEFIPTTLRKERASSEKSQPASTSPAPTAIPGAGHTLRSTSGQQLYPQLQIPSSGATAPAAQSTDQTRYYREARKDREPMEEPMHQELYELVDLDQTPVFQEPAEPAFQTLTAPSEDSPVFRGQSFDNYTNPPNLMYGETPQGDLLGPQLPSPAVPPGYVDLDVYLSEARTGRFMVGAGVNSDSGVVGNIVLEEQNFDITRFPTSFRDVVDGYAFRGGGQQFRLEATPGSEVSRYLVSWTDPYIMNTDYSLGVSGFFYQRYFRDWREERLGGRINVGKLLTRELSFNTAIRLENVNISNPRLAPGLAPSIDEMLGDNFLGSGRFSLGYDTRDSSYMATEGYNVNSSVEQAFGDYDFTKLELLGSQYFTTYQRPDGAGKHVLSLRGSLGWTTDDTPAFERFYAGGFQSFRGFEFRSISPLEPDNVGSNGAAVGGNFQLLGTTEYMFPLLANEALRGVVFSDFGTVDEDVSLDKFRVSVGAGLRISIPQMGPVPIALDWAVPIVKQDSDLEQIFSFYIGLTR